MVFTAFAGPPGQRAVRERQVGMQAFRPGFKEKGKVLLGKPEQVVGWIIGHSLIIIIIGYGLMIELRNLSIYLGN